VVEISPGDVDQFRGLLLNGGNHFRMTMPGGGNCDTGGEVEELIAVHVFNTYATATLRDHGIRPRVTGRNEAVVFFHDAFCIRTGQGTVEFRSKFAQSLSRFHLFSPCMALVLAFSLFWFHYSLRLWAAMRWLAGGVCFETMTELRGDNREVC